VASDVRTTIGAVKALLQGITGGSYTIDLSATGRVRIGRPGPADGTTPPCAWLTIGSFKSKRSEELGSYERRLVLDIEVRVPATTSDSDERILAAADALDDVTTRLQTTPAVGSCLDSSTEGVIFDGDEVGIPGCGIAWIAWEGWWISTSGEGT